MAAAWARVDLPSRHADPHHRHLEPSSLGHVAPQVQRLRTAFGPLAALLVFVSLAQCFGAYRAGRGGAGLCLLPTAAVWKRCDDHVS